MTHNTFSFRELEERLSERVKLQDFTNSYYSILIKNILKQELQKLSRDNIEKESAMKFSTNIIENLYNEVSYSPIKTI